MQNVVKGGVPVLGIIFLAVAVLQFVKGDAWVVWAILGFLFGGFGIFTMKRDGGTGA